MLGHKGTCPDFLRAQAALIAARSVEELLRELQHWGRKLTQADDLEIALMKIADHAQPGEVVFYRGEAQYTRDQLAFVDQHSSKHPLFAMAAAGNMPTPLEPQDVAGLAWKENPMYVEIYRPCSVYRSLFASLRPVPGFTLTIKAVRYKDVAFRETSRTYLILLQNLVGALLARWDMLAQLCHACHAAKQRRGTVLINKLGPAVFNLSQREAAVLVWVEAGKRDSEIGIILGVNVRTVQSHVGSLLEKLGCESRLQLIISQVGRLVDLNSPTESVARNGSSP